MSLNLQSSDFELFGLPERFAQDRAAIDARWKELPVIMITSRIAQKHRDHAAELGVDHYLGKPYSEEDLLALIGRYTAHSAPA